MTIFSFSKNASMLAFVAVLLLGNGAVYGVNDSVQGGQRSSYREIGDMYMRSFGLDKETEPVLEGQEEESNKITQLQLSENEKISLTFTLLASLEEKSGKIKGDELLRTAVEDLEVFYAPGRDHESTLFAHLNNTRTVFGQAGLGKLLANPTIDKEILSKRQAFIKELVENEYLFNELDRLLADIHRAEENILSFWKNETSVTKSAINKLYFGKRLNRFNTNPIALETKARMRNLFTGLHVGAEFFTFVGMNYIPPKISSLVVKHIGDPSQNIIQCPSLWQSTKNSCQAIWAFYSPKKWIGRFFHPYRQLAGNQVATYEQMINVGKELDPEYLESIREGTSRQNKLSLLFWTGALAGVTAYTAFQYYNKKKIISTEMQAHELERYLQQRLIDVASLISSAKQIEDLSSIHSDMAAALSSLEKSSALFNEDNDSVSSAGKKLVNLLLSNTFKGESSVFSLTGRVLSAYQLMGSNKDELICAMELIGELDAYLSIAKLYKKHTHTPAVYRFVEYVESEKPYMNMHGFWNPVLNPHKAVLNDIELGDGARNAIITGSNTGGKSTMLKALSINTLLAQTIGIVPAHACVMTPFALITTSLNIKDDTSAGQSLYKAEVLRAQKLIEAAKKLQPGKFAFYVIDELFTGTSPEKGQEAAYQVAMTLYKSVHTMYLWATHYPRLTQLEEDTNGSCKNFKMEAYQDKETGELIRPFKLEEGISTSNIATEILASELESNSGFVGL